MRFEQLITAPHRALLEERDVRAAWAAAATTFSAQVLGPHVEELARRWTAGYSGDGLGIPLGTVGSAVVNDGEARRQHEVDVVGLRRLERIRALIAAKDDRDSEAQLVLFGRSGFDTRLTAAAAGRDDVHLVSLGTMYA